MNKESIRVVIFKEVGKVRRFTISPGLALGVSLFFLFYIVASVYFTNKYFDARRAHKIQADRIATLSRELLKAARSLQRSRQHIALLDDYIREGKAQGPEAETASNYTESSLLGIVDIEDLKTRRDGSTINVIFRIVNTQSNEEPVEGYIFVLVRVKDSDRSETCIYPSSPLEDGVPVDYRNGYRFSIHNFMSMTSKLRLGESIDKQLVLEILVYDEDGTLILKKAADL